MSREEPHAQNVSDIKSIVAKLDPDAKRDVITEAMKTLHADAAGAIVAEMVKVIPQADVQKQPVGDAVREATPEEQTEIADETLQSLPAEAREEVLRSLIPNPSVPDPLKLIVVWTFIIVFGVSFLALIVAVFLQPEHVGTMATVVTTLAGTLAGFLSGRAAST
jgi:CHASE3 domain sensor protein